VEGEPLAWASSCLSYTIQRDGLPSISHDELSAAADAAFRAWDELGCASGQAPPSVSVRDVFGASACGRVEYNANQANANVIVLRDSWEHARNALAVTTVSFGVKTGEIYDADMEINGLLPIGAKPLATHEFDLQSIITHEAGHFLGIAHSNKGEADDCRNGATMCSRAQPGLDDFRTLDEDDVAAVCTIYPPERAVPACDRAPRRGFSPECGLDPMTGGGCSMTVSPRPSSSPAITALVLGFGIWASRARRVVARRQKLK
jgi:hypothetical protein